MLNMTLDTRIVEGLNKDEFIALYKELYKGDCATLYNQLIDLNGGNYKLSEEVKKPTKSNRKKRVAKQEGTTEDNGAS